MNKKYDIVAFDLDGTLTNPEAGLIASFVYALGKAGIDYGDKSTLHRFIGPPIYTEWQKVFGITPAHSTVALNLFHEYYSVYGWWDNEMYGGVSQMLAELKKKGKKIILSTSKPEHFAKKILALFGIDKYFDFIGGAISDKERDKKHEVLEYALNSVGATDRSRCILVGDRCYDAEGAKICGIDSLGVLYGHGTEEEILAAGFTRVAKTVEEINKILE